MEQKVNHFINLDPKWIIYKEKEIKFWNPYTSETYLDTVIDFYLQDPDMAKKINSAKLKDNINDFGKLLLHCFTKEPLDHYADSETLHNDVEK